MLGYTYPKITFRISNNVKGIIKRYAIVSVANTEKVRTLRTESQRATSFVNAIDEVVRENDND